MIQSLLIVLSFIPLINAFIKPFLSDLVDALLIISIIAISTILLLLSESLLQAIIYACNTLLWADILRMRHASNTNWRRVHYFKK